MKNIDMNTIQLLINDKLYELSQDDKNTIFNTIYNLMKDVNVSKIWEQRMKDEGKTSLEQYVFDGVIKFMKEKKYTASQLFNYENTCDIFNCIHGF